VCSCEPLHELPWGAKRDESAMSAGLSSMCVLACSWVKCDPIDILREVDASYFSHVEDRRFRKYESDLQLRLADFTA